MTFLQHLIQNPYKSPVKITDEITKFQERKGESQELSHYYV